MKSINFSSVVKGISQAFILATLVLCFPVFAHGIDVPLISTQVSTINLPQTGQTKCYDSLGNEINCGGTGQDGESQAGVEWPDPRFTVSGDCVTDNLTGLMWAKNGNLAKGTTTWTTTWQAALDFVAFLNNDVGLCGYSDWRLPNENELESLVNVSEADSATWLIGQGFSNVQARNCLYWSSTTYAYDTGTAWTVYMWYGSAGGRGKSVNGYVWPVRSGQSGTLVQSEIWKTGQTTSYASGDDGDLEKGVSWPVPRFNDHGDGTITDNLTGLMWSKDANLPNGTRTWHGALDFVNSINGGAGLGGYHDWRLPNRKELFSLIDHSRYGPALPADSTFQNVQEAYYWSSTTDAYDTGTAWVFYMSNVSVGPYIKSSSHSVWPVRSGYINNLRGTVIDLSIGSFIPVVTVSTINGNTQTNGKGNYYLRITPGVYDVTFSKAGYQTLTISNVAITEGKVTELNVKLQESEVLSTPNTPNGPISGATGTSYIYSTGGSSSSFGHPVQYFFDWGDQTNSGWLPIGTTSASHSWGSVGTYSVKVQARCATHSSILSSWSGTLSVTMSIPETVSKPSVLSGPTSGTAGTSYSYTTGGSTSSYGHTVECQFDWKGDGTDLSSWGSTTQSKAWTAPGTYNVRARARCTLDTSVMSDWSGSIQVAIASSRATRTLSRFYTPSLPLTVAIAINPGAATQTYSAEDSPPNGWTVSNINENGQWDGANKKVKWGVFFDNNPRTLTYQVTPPIGETGVKLFSGKASFDGVNEVIGGDSKIEIGALLHPADTSLNFELSISEVTAYAAAWRSGQTWPVPPNPIPIEYPTNAGYLWRNGEVYHYDGTQIPPSCWVPGAATGSLSVIRSLSLRNQTSLKSHAALSAGTATRDLPDCYTPSVAMSISITVIPGQGTQVYAVEDSPPAGWTVSNINKNGGWDDVKKKVKWGPFFDSNNRTLTYKVTPPSGETGAKTFSGTASFDGMNVAIGGDLTLGGCSTTAITLQSPSDGTTFGACSLYSLPTFSWTAGETFKGYKIQFSSDNSFSLIPVKVKTTTPEATITSSTWKRVLSIPGGTVYWRVVGTLANRKTATSEVFSIIIEVAQPVEGRTISPTSKTSLPTLSWENICNTKFKVWFGSDEQFSKKTAFAFNIRNPNDNEGEFTKVLTSGQWMAIRRVVRDISGSTIYWYVESWDSLGRYSKTNLMNFVLTE